MYNINVTDPYFLPHCGCDVALQVSHGEALLISGENGLGKTTLARRIFQENSHNISYIEQAPQDLFYDRKLSKIKHLLNVDHELWNAFGLHQKEDRYQSSLSGGEGQALKLVLGLSKKADLIILDEPSQFLDQKSREVLNSVVQKFVSQKKAIIIIEHDMKWVTFQYSAVELIVVDHTIRKGRTWNI